MFEDLHDGPGIIRRITSGLLDLAKASIPPLRRRAARRYILRSFVFFYAFGVPYLHYVGYRSWHPEFHRVRESLRDAALDSLSMALVGTVIAYFALLRDRDWL